MNSQKIIIYFLSIVIAWSLFLACGGSAVSGEESGANEATRPTTEVSADGSDGSDESGPEYASAYICPMYCPGSGSVDIGNCPVCGMDYVANEKHPSHQADAPHHHAHNGQGDHDGLQP